MGIVTAVLSLGNLEFDEQNLKGVGDKCGVTAATEKYLQKCAALLGLEASQVQEMTTRTK